MNYHPPGRLPERSQNHYASFKHCKREITERRTRKDLFSLTINAASEKVQSMNEQQFLIDLIFKPSEPGLRLRPAETQLLLAYMGEILKEIEEEEKVIIEEEKDLSNGQ